LKEVSKGPAFNRGNYNNFYYNPVLCGNITCKDVRQTHGEYIHEMAKKKIHNANNVIPQTKSKPLSQ
jgi:hypothetical protein